MPFLCRVLCVLCSLLIVCRWSPLRADNRPNIVVILCDDLGYGDVHCMAPGTCRIATPGIDRLAEEGMLFTDAHSGSSVCTPTRYGLLTGRYSWRTRLQKGVTVGFAPCLIAEDRPTVASFLKHSGYHTGIVGKWHLDFQYVNQESSQPYSKKEVGLPPVGAFIPDGPLARGFDEFHGFHHARDMKAVIDGNKVVEHDEVINMLPRLVKHSVDFIERRNSADEPFFLYVPFGSPHTPIVPTTEWQGRSGLGDYADFVMQTDDGVGQILKALDDNDFTKNTLVIFSSDNGCSRAAGIRELDRQGHAVSGPLRGSKADLWDGGHRVPFVARWPGKIQPHSQSDQLICLVDIFATLAEVLDTKPPAGSCEDSLSFLPALFGNSIPAQRNGIVHHSYSGHFAYRTKDWKLLLARGSGGWTSPNEKQVSEGTPEAQLYRITDDISESKNLYHEKPKQASRLLQLLEADVTSGRTIPGEASQNDVDEIRLWKSGRGPATKPKPKAKKRKDGK